MIMNQTELSPFNPVEVSPGLSFQTDKELLTAAGKIGTTIFHPVGTCSMINTDREMDNNRNNNSNSDNDSDNNNYIKKRFRGVVSNRLKVKKWSDYVSLMHQFSPS